MSVAGSRLHRLGSVYSRTKDLIRSKVLPYEERPLWYDVYEAFPPIREPVYEADTPPDKLGLVDVEDNVREVLYEEDWVRANVNGVNFYSSLNNKTISSLFTELTGKHKERKNFCYRFVKKFQEIQKLNNGLNNEQLFRMTEQEMKDAINELKEQ
uniref:Small ribosomal subunit protein mS23 n=1 Tax=Ciona intestinalis TaxID=7719 RepID=F6ZFU8_CIOIN|nr:28S ribosomal protein S23, mitochondrial-like [Ciona intestinalis]|eukprot:XP_002120130.1 28S ribosomal protein S23, mitochondrial-like [Ciona intestinalis]